MIDKAQIGKTFRPHSVEVEKGPLRFFALAIGETNPIYSVDVAAEAAGYRALPVPPTFLFSLEMDQPNPLGWLREMGFDLARILHGEQSFIYYTPVCAGDVLTFNSRIEDIYDKKDGALEFVVKETHVSDQTGRHVADLRTLVVQRNT